MDYILRPSEIYTVELLVSSVSQLLLRDLIEFIVEYNDSQAYVEESMESKAVAKFF